MAKHFRSKKPDMPVIYISGEVIDPERCVPGSVFVAKPYQHIDILSACRRLHRQMTVVGLVSRARMTARKGPPRVTHLD